MPATGSHCCAAPAASCSHFRSKDTGGYSVPSARSAAARLQPTPAFQTTQPCSPDCNTPSHPLTPTHHPTWPNWRFSAAWRSSASATVTASATITGPVDVSPSSLLTGTGPAAAGASPSSSLPTAAGAAASCPSLPSAAAARPSVGAACGCPSVAGGPSVCSSVSPRLSTCCSTQ